MSEQKMCEDLAHDPCNGMNCGITNYTQEHSLQCQAEHMASIAGGWFVLEKPNEKNQLSDKIEVLGFVPNNSAKLLASGKEYFAKIYSKRAFEAEQGNTSFMTAVYTYHSNVVEHKKTVSSDLLNALEAMVQSYEYEASAENPALLQARAAIAKARGAS